jgi:hypothetical protein
MIPLLVFCSLLVAAMAVVLIVGIRHAVDGYEDETGFHVDKTPVAQTKTPSRRALPAVTAVAGKGS